MKDMTPEQKLKHAVLTLLADRGESPISEEVNSKTIDDLYGQLIEKGKHWDGEAELRGGSEETGIACVRSSNYESKSVAAKMPDGSWVGWTYWYGGGKHSEAGSIDWMSEAYNLTCKKEAKVVITRTFSKVND